LAALTTGVAAVVEQGRQKSQELDATTAQIAALNQQIEALAGDKMAMEADLEDKDRALEDLNIQIESLNEQLASPPAPTEAIGDVDAQIQTLTAQVADLQGQLDAANAAKADLEQQLSATQAQLDDLTAQIEGVKQQMESVLSPEDLATLQVSERGPAVEGEEGVEAEAKEGVGPLGLAALAGGVAAAINRNKSQTADLDSQLAALQEQIAALNSDKAGLEASLQEKEQALANFNEHLLSQQGQVNELAAGQSTTEAMLQAKEQELIEAQAQVQTMQATIDDLTAQLQGVTAQVSDLETQAEAVAPFEQAADIGERLSKLPAIKQTAASAALILGKQPVLTPKVQALTNVAGIGSVRQQKLYNAGVGTFWELSNLDNDMLENLFSLSASRLQRVDFNETRASARQLADETDTVGLLWDGERVDDMEPIAGIGRVFEQRLYEAGLTTYESIAGTTPEHLAEVIHAPEFNQPDYGAWINDAKLLVEMQQQDEAAKARAVEQPETPDSTAQG
jgi:predicted flap endonuclease-1-like 5' DNA nuclease